jgi:hypothetical protein
VATKSVSLYNAESGVTFTAGEPSPSSVAGTSGSVTVSPGDISADSNDSSVTGNATVADSTPLTITITLKDTWRNPISGVAAGNVVLAASGGGESITQPSSPTDSSGQTTGSITWSTSGSKTVSATIGTVTLVQNDGTSADADGKLDDTLGVTVTAAVYEHSTVQPGVIFKPNTTIQ